MNDDETLPPIPQSSGGGVGAAEADGGDAWPTAGPAKGLRIRLPIAIACLAVVALAGAAAGATLKKPSSTSTVQAGAIGRNRANGAAGTNGATGANGAAGRFGAGGGGVFGTITKVEGNTITVTQRDGTTATVVVPTGTTITKTVSGALSDLKAGTSIAVRGTTADGRTTAESVTINPANGGALGPGGFGGARAGGTGTTATTTN